ncbi:MAG: HAMP domain-containing protein [Lachnospiraceae bacterium]|nr:HAMP domain-containing protein [Lachnospiraceae bacterium]
MNRLSSIRVKMALGTSFLFLIFILNASVIWYFSMQSQAEKTAIDNIQSTVNIAETSMDTRVKDIINIASLVTIQADNTLNANILTVLENRDNLTEAQLVNYRKTSSEYLVSLCSFQKYLSGLRISNFEGEGLSYGNSTTIDIMEKNNYLDSLSMDGSITFIEPHYWTDWYKNSSDYVFSVMKPVKNNYGERIGYVIADIDSHIFEDSFGKINNKSSLYVLNEDASRVIYSKEKKGVEGDLAIQLPQLVEDKVGDDYGNFMITVGREKYLVAYTRSPLTNWIAISVIPHKVVMADFADSANRMIVTTVFILLICFSLIWLYSSMITRNIVGLTEAVKKVGKEQMTLDFTITSKDEVKELATQFQNMLSRISMLYEQMKEKELEKRKAEIAALQFQMNPHFLYNSLNTIRFLATIQGIENIKNVAEILSSMMHINMDGRAEVTIKEDVQFIKDYLKLQTYRQISLFTSNVECDREIMDCRISKLLVQPLVENSIKHGFIDGGKDCAIDVSYSLVDGNVWVTVEDNGAGIDEAQMDAIMTRKANNNAGHIGLANIKERINLNYGEPYTMKVESVKGEFTRITLVLPLIKGEEDA